MAASSYLNLCRSCSTDFASVEGFDRHRIGTHAYTLTEGLRMDPPKEDGGRCLSPAEMPEAGTEVDDRGRWRIARERPSDTPQELRTGDLSASGRWLEPGPFLHPAPTAHLVLRRPSSVEYDDEVVGCSRHQRGAEAPAPELSDD
jgi:hypothetical protein